MFSFNVPWKAETGYLFLISICYADFWLPGEMDALEDRFEACVTDPSHWNLGAPKAPVEAPLSALWTPSDRRAYRGPLRALWLASARL